MALTKITATNIGANAVTASSIGYTPANRAGDTFTGQVMIENQAESGYANNLAESVTKAVVKMKPHNLDSTLTTFGSMANGVAGSDTVGSGYIQRSNGPGTGTYDLYINPYGGAVMKPNQPAFIYQGTSYTQAAGGASVIIPGTTILNRGSYYNGTTGVFTAPVTGLYLFGYDGLIYPVTAGDVYAMYYRRNGSIYGNNTQFGVTAGSHHQISGVRQMSLTKNDTVDLVLSTPAGSTGKGYATQFNMWGHLIG